MNTESRQETRAQTDGWVWMDGARKRANIPLQLVQGGAHKLDHKTRVHAMAQRQRAPQHVLHREGREGELRGSGGAVRGPGMVAREGVKRSGLREQRMHSSSKTVRCLEYKTGTRNMVVSKHPHNGPAECSMLHGLQPAPLPCSPRWRRRPAAACTAPAPPARAMQQGAGWTPGCSGESEGGDNAA